MNSLGKLTFAQGLRLTSSESFLEVETASSTILLFLSTGLMMDKTLFTIWSTLTGWNNSFLTWPCPINFLIE